MQAEQPAPISKVARSRDKRRTPGEKGHDVNIKVGGKKFALSKQECEQSGYLNALLKRWVSQGETPEVSSEVCSAGMFAHIACFLTRNQLPEKKMELDPTFVLSFKEKADFLLIPTLHLAIERWATVLPVTPLHRRSTPLSELRSRQSSTKANRQLLAYLPSGSKVDVVYQPCDSCSKDCEGWMCSLQGLSSVKANRGNLYAQRRLLDTASELTHTTNQLDHCQQQVAQLTDQNKQLVDKELQAKQEVTQLQNHHTQLVGRLKSRDFASAVYDNASQNLMRPLKRRKQQQERVRKELSLRTRASVVQERSVVSSPFPLWSDSKLCSYHKHDGRSVLSDVYEQHVAQSRRPTSLFLQQNKTKKLDVMQAQDLAAKIYQKQVAFWSSTENYELCIE
eukprot:gb/GEZN01007200.1/.p1 GENE.gb/GEZN01007200.1/~~gb/GEZN01007200.1/.p1  ORF type:complete len:394 (-),score=64.57 gb/GEZN01007200.1/:285-1466(-)